MNCLSLLHKAVNNLSWKGHMQVSYSNLMLREMLTLKQCLKFKKGISGPCPGKLWISPQMKIPKPLLFLVPTENYSHHEKVSPYILYNVAANCDFLTPVFQYALLGSEALPFPPSKIYFLIATTEFQNSSLIFFQFYSSTILTATIPSHTSSLHNQIYAIYIEN